MLLLCNNIRLDLYENTNLQFKHTNPLFAFDKLECERTTQFKLPTTPANDRAFALARVPAYAGAGMRRKFAAQLQEGTIMKDGYLCVSEYDGKDYTAIFVTGELLSLQAVKNAGKISEFYDNNTIAKYGVIETNPFVGQIFQTLQYANILINNGGVSAYSIDASACRPCINLYLLMVYALQQTLGMGLATVPTDLRDIVYIPEQFNDANGEEIKTAGANIRLGDNLPEWTGIELIQALANLGGYLPNYENDTLSFVKDLSELSATVDITGKLTKRGQVTRALSGFSRHNTVEWKNADQYGLQSLAFDYQIDNDNIEDTRVLHTIPAQPARYVSTVMPSITGVALLWDKYARDNFIQRDIVPLGAEWIARFNTGATNQNTLLAYDIYSIPPANPIMQAICAQETQIKVEARMSMLEYYAIRPKTTLQVDGSRYVWLERSWQRETATFTLAKIS